MSRSTREASVEAHTALATVAVLRDQVNVLQGELAGTRKLVIKLVALCAGISTSALALAGTLAAICI